MRGTVCQNLSSLLVLRIPSRISWTSSGATGSLGPMYDYKTELTALKSRIFY